MDIKEFVEEACKSQGYAAIPWHLKTLCEHIESIERGEIKKLTTNPPFPIRLNKSRGYKLLLESLTRG
jgi:hypothetical protein